MKCELCKQKVQETFLEKPIGTHIKDKNGKKHIICGECQRKYKTKEEIIDKL